MSDRVKGLIRKHAERADSIVAAADNERRKLTDGEWTEVQNALGEAGKLKDMLDKSESVSNAIQGLDHIGHDDNGGSAAVSQPAQGVKQYATPGETFVKSEEYANLLSTKGHGAWDNRRRVVMNESVPVSTSKLYSRRNEIVTGSSNEFLDADGTSAGLLVEPEQRTLPPTYQRELNVRDVLSTIPVGTDTVEYVKVDSVVNRAAAVPEATSAASRHESDQFPASQSDFTSSSTNPAGYKPESQLVFNQETERVRTIAHTVPVTKKALADAPQVRAIIDTFLRYGLEEHTEDLILTGDGAGENFLGLLDASREQSSPGVLDGVQVYSSAEDLLVKAKRAKTLARLARGGRPTAFLMHPQTWEEYELARDNDDRFFGNGPFASADVETLWRLPVVQSEAVPEDEVIVGNWRQAVIFDRQASTLTATDSHEDFFIRNLVMILAEVRAGFAVLHEPSFVKFDVSTS